MRDVHNLLKRAEALGGEVSPRQLNEAVRRLDAAWPWPNGVPPHLDMPPHAIRLGVDLLMDLRAMYSMEPMRLRDDERLPLAPWQFADEPVPDPSSPPD